MRKARILFVLESYFPGSTGGTETYVKYLAEGVMKKGFHAAIIISSTDHELLDYSYDNVDVKVFHIPESPSVIELSGIRPPAGIELFKERVLEISPQIIHFHSFGRAINAYHLKWAKEQGIKTVFTPHLGSFFCIKGSFFLFDKTDCDGEIREKRCLQCHYMSQGFRTPASWVLSSIFSGSHGVLRKLLPPQSNIVKHRHNEVLRVKQNADAIIAIAPWILKLFRLNGLKDNLHLVNQGAQIDPGSHLSKKWNPDTKVSLVFIGRMHPSKGFHLLVEALEKTPNKNYSLSIYTMESGGEQNYYNKYIDWARKTPEVEWFEALAHKDLMEDLKEKDLLILPSVANEMAPLVILEAYHFKIPVLGSSYPAIKDMIDDDVTGSVFESNNAFDLQNKLNKILDEPELLRKWSKNIGPVRTFNELTTDMEKIYNSLLK